MTVSKTTLFPHFPVSCIGDDAVAFPTIELTVLTHNDGILVIRGREGFRDKLIGVAGGADNIRKQLRIGLMRNSPLLSPQMQGRHFFGYSTKRVVKLMDAL